MKVLHLLYNVSTFKYKNTPYFKGRAHITWTLKNEKKITKLCVHGLSVFTVRGTKKIKMLKVRDT